MLLTGQIQTEFTM